MPASHRPNMRVASELPPKGKKRNTNPPKQTIRGGSCAPFNRASPNPYTDTRRVSAILRRPSLSETATTTKQTAQALDPRPTTIYDLRHPRLSYHLHATTSAAPNTRDFASPSPSEDRNYNETNGVSALTYVPRPSAILRHPRIQRPTLLEPPPPPRHPRFCVTALPARPQLQRNKRRNRIPASFGHSQFCVNHDFPTTYNLRPSSTMAIEHENH
jgi:hypothetical protein